MRKKRHKRLFVAKVKRILRKKKKNKELEMASKCPYFIDKYDPYYNPEYIDRDKEYGK